MLNDCNNENGKKINGSNKRKKKYTRFMDEILFRFFFLTAAHFHPAGR